MLFRWNCFPVSFPSEDSASAPSSTKKELSLHPLVSSTLGQGTPIPLRHEAFRSLLGRGTYSPPPPRESQSPRELLYKWSAVERSTVLAQEVPFIATAILDGSAY